MKKKCLCCKKELVNCEKVFCKTCRDFFEWKHKDNGKFPINHLIKMFKTKGKKSQEAKNEK